ncbi:MAG: CpsB/CapC family capsule biosynthesis tyrosine phosphatase [Candidatus Cloacimonadota bacterium]|nr:CpsB/CapC family capsule biosynthesis tyrosine phosphatase [Candidatus Cloacimonadota bacterium]
MIDLHTHILPAIDDGSADMQTSISFLKKMADCGITDVVCTSHYIRHQFHNTYAVRKEKFDLLKNEAYKQNIQTNLHLAAEVYLETEILQDIKQEKMNIDDTNYILVETDFTGFPPNLKELLYQLVKEGYNPILAHPERYSNLKKNPELAEEFMHRNVLLQLNAASLLGGYGRASAKAAWKMLEMGFCHFIASDCHCRSGEYQLPAAADLITRKLDNYTAQLITVENPQKVLDNKKIDMFYLENVEIKKKTVWNKIKSTFNRLS